ncbi:hypothetical protein JMY81_04970 [Brenneria goodwinii]|uniref:hypothetical protein n=1 Tax=Brenneria goodwinii TaxID=1109412 RepID=UPI0011C3774E|nr:hypothetical protein [Brenneria goodwinii]MCG8156704.1 hypothetical protein [Brenneria goodwinii]MCG8160184.1 hypothetical protein [Brenneria goodwinii]MCG8164707.1 hypothetical protein [Brenneria goodwinii]MCG8171537.1 hypothetical protein [Brenneria goodwinii]MCG8174115.1 hypothetical protein [Brenneria goodwinii]
MKKKQVENEENSAFLSMGKTRSALALSVANRLRKNLCQDLSSLGRNGLHYRPVLERAIIF